MALAFEEWTYSDLESLYSQEEDYYFLHPESIDGLFYDLYNFRNDKDYEMRVQAARATATRRGFYKDSEDFDQKWDAYCQKRDSDKTANKETAKPQSIAGLPVYQANPNAARPSLVAGGNLSAATDESTLPEWVIEKTAKNGSVSRSINEPMFCNEFKVKYHAARINTIFYFDGEAVTDDKVLMSIQTEIEPYFVQKTGMITLSLFKTLSNSCYTVQPEPDERKIYCQGNITLYLDKNGIPTPIEEDVFTLTRLPVKYNPEATCPTFEKYLTDLFYPGDIPAIQEFMGYCLIPSTRAQAGLFIHGIGGEGKSILKDVVMRLHGRTAVQEAIHVLGDRFNMANLENKLVSVDDDMRSDLFSDTSFLKKLITAKEKMLVERKGKDKYQTDIYARVFAIGNTFIGSKFDQSDGFYRRQLLIDCKPKTRTTDDRFMSDKCVAEIEGIFIWALVGLIRLIQNGFNFTISERMQNTLDDIKMSNDNTIAFYHDDSFVKITDDWTSETSSVDLFRAYALWCKDNGDTPVKRRTFQARTKERFRERNIRIVSFNGRCQGYKGITLTDRIRERLKYTNSETADIDRLL